MKCKNCGKPIRPRNDKDTFTEEIWGYPNPKYRHVAVPSLSCRGGSGHVEIDEANLVATILNNYPDPNNSLK